YDRARPQDQSVTGAGSAPAIDPAFVQKLRTFEYRRPSGATMTYGQLVAAADNIASLALLEAQDRERQGAAGQIPVLSHIWRWIGDKTHYLDLASRNLKHFHPHNFMAWQSWQWKALHTMSEARTLIGEANAAT